MLYGLMAEDRNFYRFLSEFLTVNCKRGISRAVN